MDVTEGVLHLVPDPETGSMRIGFSCSLEEAIFIKLMTSRLGSLAKKWRNCFLRWEEH